MPRPITYLQDVLISSVLTNNPSIPTSNNKPTNVFFLQIACGSYHSVAVSSDAKRKIEMELVIQSREFTANFSSRWNASMTFVSRAASEEGEK